MDEFSHAVIRSLFSLDRVALDYTNARLSGRSLHIKPTPKAPKLDTESDTILELSTQGLRLNGANRLNVNSALPERTFEETLKTVLEEGLI